MTGLGGFRAVFILMLALALALLIHWGFLQSGWGDWTVPSPEGTAEQFLSAMEAGRYYGAANLLSSQLKEEVGEEGLRRLGQAIEESRGGLQKPEEKDSQIEGDTAVAAVEVGLGNGERVELEFPLSRDNFVWQVDGLEPLQALAGSQ